MTNFPLFRLFLLVCTLLFSVSLDASAARREFGVDRPGMDYRSFDLRRPSYMSCEMACRREGQCRAWTYVKPGIQGRYARCWLKHSVPAPVGNGCCVSGTKF